MGAGNPLERWRFRHRDVREPQFAPRIAGRVPASAAEYQIPAIDGLDPEAAAASPLFEALKAGAHKNGVGQAAFEAIVGDYVAAEVAKADVFEQQQLVALGANAETRVKEIGKWLDRTFTPERAAALRGAAATAAGVEALEDMMNVRAGVKPRDPPPPPTPTDTKETIEVLMRSPAYRGKETERDPAVIKRVEDWFEANAAPKTRK